MIKETDKTDENEKWAKDQISYDRAVAFYKSEAWKLMSDEEIVKLQLFQKLLCVPFGVYHKATETVLGRPVYTHEFAFRDSMVKEYLGEKEAPTLQEIMDLIPSEKRIIIGL